MHGSLQTGLPEKKLSNSERRIQKSRWLGSGRED